MITLSATNNTIKNSLFDSGAWLILLTLTNVDQSVVLNIINNNENILFDTTTYTAFPFSLEEMTESNKGELPTVNLVLSNVDRIVQTYVENDPDYGSGWTVHIDIVHSSAVASGVSELSYDFITTGVSANESSVSFACGLKNPLRHQFPRVKMLPNLCQNTFKRGGCIYAGADVICTKTIADCRTKFTGASKIPFLGFPGIPTTGMYV